MKARNKLIKLTKKESKKIIDLIIVILMGFKKMPLDNLFFWNFIC